MKTIALLDTGIGTMNIGTQMIMDCVYEFFYEVFSRNQIITVPTHTPIRHIYQEKTRYLNIVKNSDYKFVCGSNLMSINMKKKSPLWNVNLFDTKILEGTIFIGVGRSGIGDSDINHIKNIYTKHFYNKILSKDFYHSVRDEKTKKLMESIGLKAINTGCPTLWKLTDEYCSKIPTNKHKNVIFTINSNSKDFECWQKTYDLLRKLYQKVYFFSQTFGDLDCFMKLNNYMDSEIIANNLKSYNSYLDPESVDYVGERLHGGIYAMNKMVRSIIISIDYRSVDMAESFNLNLVKRNDFVSLEKKILNDFSTKIGLHEEKVHDFLNQFEL